MLFRSDPRPLRAALALHEETRPKLDAAFVAAYLRDSLIWHETDTFTAQIKKLPPGHVLRWGGGRSVVQRWWRPDTIATDRRICVDEAAKRLQPLIEQATTDRLRTSLPVGLHVSGGLDSSLTAALATAHLRARGASSPTSWTWSPASEIGRAHV